jgi:AraC-like DNA-binding protein
MPIPNTSAPLALPHRHVRRLPPTVSTALRHLRRYPVTLEEGWRLPSPARCGWHVHECLEIAWECRGSGISHIGRKGQTIAFREDDLFIYPPGSVHMQECAPGAEEALLKLRLHAPLPAIWRRVWHLHPIMEGHLKAELLFLTAPPPIVDQAQAQEFDLRCAALLTRLLRELDDSRSEACQPDATRMHARQAYAYVQDNFAAIRDLNDVAQHVGLSVSHLRHIFRTCHGVGLKEFLDEMRIQHARKLLVHTVLSVKEVAAQCGFATDRYFCARFRHLEGVSPGAYRSRKT